MPKTNLVKFVVPKFPVFFKGQELFLLQPSLGLLSLASSVRKHGFDVKIHDLNVVENFESENCLAFGITGHAIQHKDIVRIAKLIRKKNSYIPIILGGSHASFSADLILSQVKEIDYIIRNEGEYSFVRLLNSIKNNEFPDDLPGLSFRRKNRIVTVPSKMVTNIEELPVPAFDLIDMDKTFAKLDMVASKIGIEEPSLSVGLSTSRGCISNCTFCTARLLQKPTLRAKSVSRVVDEINSLKAISKTFWSRIDIDFIDNTFNFTKKRVHDLCKAFRKNNFDFYWRCFCRTNLVDDELARIMAQSKCCGVFLGAETTRDSSIDKLKKGTKVDSTLNAVVSLVKFDISVILSYIIGFPWDSKENVISTLKSALSFQKISPQIECKIFKATPFPETEFWTLLEKDNLLKVQERKLDLEEFDEFDMSRRKGMCFNHPTLGEHVFDSLIVWFHLRSILINFDYLNKKELSDFHPSLFTRIRFLIAITETLGCHERFHSELLLIKDRFQCFEENSRNDLERIEKEVDLALSSSL